MSNGWKFDSINRSFAIEYIINPSVVAHANYDQSGENLTDFTLIASFVFLFIN